MNSKGQARTQKRVEVDEFHRRHAEFESMTVSQLREEYERVFDEPSASRNRRYLVKRISYRVQEMAEGGLSELARRRIEELARNAPIRRRLLTLMPYLQTSEVPADVEQESTAPAPLQPAPPRAKDPRLPPVGTVLRKAYHEGEYEVHVLDGGFEMAGKQYRSLSAVARVITGTGWNGFLFFKHELAQAKAGTE